ncbi:MAG: WD40/YVTN/BNR-like repeat-containing protein [Saprospiraceae bacterium]
MRIYLLFLALIISVPSFAQRKKKNKKAPPIPTMTFDAEQFSALKFRNIGPFRGGRSNAVHGVIGDPLTYYFGSTGGGVWKTEDAGISWNNISDGFFKTGSVGAIGIAPSDQNVIYVGMGEHAVRGVMTSHGDGVYKSTDAGKSWQHMGLPQSRHIAAVRVHPQNPDVVWVAVQGSPYGDSAERGIYKTTDGGVNWKKVKYIDVTTGACDLSVDKNNPRILYAAFWDHRRHPWTVRSGGAGSAFYKSTDGGENWEKLTKGLPEQMGKIAIDVSPADSDLLYANVEAEGEKGGVYKSTDAGKSWTQTSKDRVTIARSWYYMEIFADPQNPNVVYVLNAPMLKSIDGGKTFKPIANPHGDQHDLWINPANTQNIILGNDGGATVTFNGGKTWSTQKNQPTAQFYRVITDNRFPYHVYGGQQDNSTVAIASRTRGSGIDWKDWYPVAGGESAFLAFDDPYNPQQIYGGSYQGNISVYDAKTQTTKDIMSYPVAGLGSLPSEMKYRFNWNAPIVAQPQNPSILYHTPNVVLRSADGGRSWTEISGDLTRNDKTKQGVGGYPFTNEAAGGENYNTISYLTASPHKAGVIWVGSDDGLVHLTMDEGENWQNVTPTGIGESLINSIEVSPHDPATAYVAVTKYKFNDFTPLLYVTRDYGKTWQKMTNGIAKEDFVRVVREDPVRPDLLYAATETGLYISFNGAKNWSRFQLNLPVCPILDMTIQDNDLVVATSGRAFWILDDLSALQQSNGVLPKQEIQLFQPKTTYKFNVSTPNKPPANEGTNPASGVIFDYYLPAAMDSMELILNVLNEEGDVIRSYSNQKDKSFKRFTGGPPPSPQLPAKKGLNRFNWDLRTETFPAIAGVFTLGDYRGHLVAPGTYTLQLIHPIFTDETNVKVTADPRLTADPAAHDAQEKLLSDISTVVYEIHESVNRMRKVKTQIQNLQTTLTEIESAAALVDTGKMVIKAIEMWEENLIQPQQKTFQDVINFPNQLNAELMNLKSRVDTHTPQPTVGAQQRLKDLQGEWQGHKMEMERIIGEEVVAYNRMYAGLKLPILVVPDEK